jgi:hypothetical protein
MGVKLNEIYQLLTYADDVNLLEDNRDALNKNTETLTDASEEVGQINVEKTKFMLLSCHQNTVQTSDIKIENKSFKNVSWFKYLGMTVTIQNLIQE